MSLTDENVSLTVRIPKSLVDSVRELAVTRHASVDRVLEKLVRSGLRSELSARERFDRLSEMYRSRLAREGRLNQSDDEIMAELRAIREQVANELYPD